MSQCFSFFKSSIGRKLIMSFTGMAMSLFLIAHLAGNLQLLISTSKFNLYAHQLISLGSLLYLAEGGLIAIFSLHVLMGFRLTLLNRCARPERYALHSSAGRSSNRWWASSNMIVTGVLLLLFIIYHIFHFKFGPEYSVVEDNTAVRDLSRLVIEEFKEWEEVALYEIAMLVLGLHLLHGFRSMFETLGLSDARRAKMLKLVTKLYVVFVVGGFLMIPIWIYLEKI